MTDKYMDVGGAYIEHVVFPSSPLPPGAYKVGIRKDQLALLPHAIVTDGVVKIKGGVVDEIIKEVESFWKKKDDYKKYGFLHKRGILMHGAPGIGKTMTICQIIEGIVKRGGVVLLCEDADMTSHAITMIRKLEPERQIVVIYEDIDSLMNRNGESSMLQLLDGYNQVDTILQIATTNYLNRLPERITNRPRRFDTVVEVFPPNAEERHQFLAKKLVYGENIEEVVTATEGLSYAALTEVIISVFVLERDLKKTVARLKGLKLDEVKNTDDDDNDDWDDDDDDDENEEIPDYDGEESKTLLTPKGLVHVSTSSEGVKIAALD